MSTQFIYQLTDTWDNAGVTFDAVKMDVTDTASNAASNLFDFQVNSVSQGKLDKSGNLTVTGQINAVGGTIAGAVAFTGSPDFSSAGNKSTIRSDLGLAIGSDVLAYDANLQSFATTFTLPTSDGSANQFLKTDGSGNIDFADVSTGSTVVADLSALEALTGGEFDAVVLQDELRGGVFSWDGSNLSSVVSLDTEQGVYVAPSGENGSSGAWVRQCNIAHVQAEWFGATGDGSTDDSTAIQAAIDFVGGNSGKSRGGTVYLGEGRYRVASTILLEDSGVALEGLYPQITVQGNRISRGSGITGITQANPAVVTTSAAHSLSTGDIVFLTGITGMGELNDRFFQVGAVTSTTFELANEDSSAYTAYSSGGDVRESVGSSAGGVLVVDHSSGPGVWLKSQDCQLKNLDIEGSASRMFGAMGSGVSTNCGVLISSNNTNAFSRFNIEDVMCRQHRADGFVACQQIVHGSFARCTALDNRRNGFVVDGGQLLGLSTTRSGITDIINCRSRNNMAHALVVGNPSEGSNTPYRVYLRNFESFFCGTERTDMLDGDYSHWVRGEQIVFETSALANADSTSNENSVLFLAGRDVRMSNNRMGIEQTTLDHLIRIEDVSGFVNRRIVIDGMNTFGDVTDYLVSAASARQLTIKNVGGNFTNYINAVTQGGPLWIENEDQIIYNTNSTLQTGQMYVGNSGTGDATIRFELTGTQSWSAGVDNSIGDSFAIQPSTALNSSAPLSISTGGVVTIKDLDVDLSSGQDIDVTANDTNINGQIYISQAGAGDTAIRYGVSGQEWIAGIDNSSSDRFGIQPNSSLNSSSPFYITTAGQTTITDVNITGGEISGVSDLDVNLAFGNRVDIIANDSTTTGTLLVQNSGTGDAVAKFSAGSTPWCVGVDNSSGDCFSIRQGSSLNITGASMRIYPAGDIILRPPSTSSITTNNGDLSIEATNNTTLTFRYRGTDGVERTGTVTLS